MHPYEPARYWPAIKIGFQELKQFHIISSSIRSLYLHVSNLLFCWQVYMLSWIERKAAATLFAMPPTSTAQEALTHFLEVPKQNWFICTTSTQVLFEIHI